RHHRQHQKSDADHDAESEEGYRHRRPVLGLELFEALDLAVETMGQDEAAEIGHLDREAIGLVGRVWNGEQRERKGRLGIPARFDGGNLRRLIGGGVEPVLAAKEYLQRNKEREYPERHRKNTAPSFAGSSLADQQSGDRHDHETRGDKEARNRVG